MPQKKSKSVGNKEIAQVKRSSSPKRFYLLLLTALLGLLLFVTYYASQQIQVYQSKASGGKCSTGGEVCDVKEGIRCCTNYTCKIVTGGRGTCRATGCSTAGKACDVKEGLKCCSGLTCKIVTGGRGTCCATSCTVGDKKCANGKAQVCKKQSNGCNNWVTETCKYGCSGNVCKKTTTKPPTKTSPKPPTKCTNKCSPVGKKKCTSGNAQVCKKQSNGCTDWDTTKCKNGCSNGKCKTAGGGGETKCTSIEETKKCNDTAGCKWFNICSKCDISSKGTIEVCGGGGGGDENKCTSIEETKKCNDTAGCKWFNICDTCDLSSKGTIEVCSPTCDQLTNESECTAQECYWDPETGTCMDTSPDVPETGTATLALTLSFQGINQTPISGETTMDVLVTLAGGPEGQEIPSTGTFTVDSSGKWTGEVSFDELALGGDYKVLVKGPKHIQKKICDAAPSEAESGTYHCGDGDITINSGTNTFDFSGAKLLVGDLAPQDGIVDSYDISLIRNSLCTTDNPDVCKDSSTLSPADLNLDGIIDTQDHSLLISSLSIKYDEK